MHYSSKRISRKNVSDSEFIYRVLKVSRVSKTTSGGRRMSVSVLVVIGNQKGVIGLGLGNDSEMKEAEAKALKAAQNNLFSIPIKKISTPSGDRYTIHHLTEGSWCSSKVLLLSAKVGSSIVGGTTVRAICECLGLTDVVTKVHKSSNPHNVSKAVFDALMKIKIKGYYSYIMGTAS